MCGIIGYTGSENAQEILLDALELLEYRGYDSAILLEGSLKLKEVSYIHSEAYASGELKHGPIALITGDTPVVATVTQSRLKSKELSNIKEVRSRGADIVLFIKEELATDLDLDDKGFDVDKPRNLAKVVTVE